MNEQSAAKYLLEHKLKYFLLLTLTFILFFMLQTGNVLASTNKISDTNQSITSVTIPEYEQNIHETKEITTDDLSKMLNRKSTFILFIGYKECPYCREFSKTLRTFLNETGLPVYYLNLRNPTPVNLHSNAVLFLKNKIKLRGTPTLALIKRNKVIHEYLGTITLNQLKTLKKYKYTLM
ncbi:PedC/BrcD family bacteriocin maturation disulfide isomerase [Levilactobacillus brevis]|uniref:PedC/BrcD family bacteriocin maturation disulfide isomerase n=1 Tax=Levilactobacillus brevis TaxID=1580 RepID=UPI0022DD24CD|nr:PedC/BrcD family bacteriocin maturation disulfide isomerase [Levilactobacillus brevis]MDA0411269.1 PedC/BrcD family bacteriocin maturation disulfide isomerase [Levilactobacillus brevis]